MDITTITPQHLFQKLQEKTAILIDVREAHEYQTQSIPQSLHIPLANIDAETPSKFPKDTLLVMQCKSGMRSLSACKQLKSHGYDHIANLEGGIIAWSQAGLPLQSATTDYLRPIILVGVILITLYALSYV